MIRIDVAEHRDELLQIRDDAYGDNLTELDVLPIEDEDSPDREGQGP